MTVKIDPKYFSSSYVSSSVWFNTSLQLFEAGEEESITRYWHDRVTLRLVDSELAIEVTVNLRFIPRHINGDPATTDYYIVYSPNNSPQDAKWLTYGIRVPGTNLDFTNRIKLTLADERVLRNIYEEAIKIATETKLLDQLFEGLN